MKDLESIVRKTDAPNLELITSGVYVPNPSELLSGTKMQTLVETMEAKYDYIIFDTPPVNLVVDALSLSNLTDGYIVVVREGVTRNPELQHAVAALEHAKVKVFGIILNGSKLEEKSYQYHYERYE